MHWGITSDAVKRGDKGRTHGLVVKLLLMYIDLQSLLKKIVEYLVLALRFHPVTSQLSSRHGRKNLDSDLEFLTKNGFDITLAIPLLNEFLNDAPDENIWNAAYSLVSSAKFPTTSLFSEEDISIAKPSHSVLHDLQNHWIGPYVPESLDALQLLIRGYERKPMQISRYYSKTLVFVQSSGMGKSRLADAFGESCCPMINFVLREEGTHGYPPADGEILSFMHMHQFKADRDIVRASPKEAGQPTQLQRRRRELIWYHSAAVGLLQASFELCKSREFIVTEVTS
jgi:hypothetical protein